MCNKLEKNGSTSEFLVLILKLNRWAINADLHFIAVQNSVNWTELTLRTAHSFLTNDELEKE